MRKPKRPRSVSREEMQRIIDVTDGDVTWDDVIETNPGRFRPTPEGVARVEENYKRYLKEKAEKDREVEVLTVKRDELREELHQRREELREVWIPARFMSSTWADL